MCHTNRVCCIRTHAQLNVFLFLSCSPGSVGVDYVATFNNTNGVNNQNLQQELVSTLNYTNNGTFLGSSDLQLSEENDPIKVAEALTFQGSCGMQSYIKPISINVSNQMSFCAF